MSLIYRTYRTSDGRGGCDGASIRFSPVANWADNASLNMVRLLSVYRIASI